MSARTNLQDLEDIVSCLEEVKNIVVARLVPEEARTHFRQAEKEVLLGVRSLLDAAIGRLDDEQPRKKERSKQIPVEE
ncbi:hypothetical protein ACFPES_06635 [Paenibacillus sp. GCM10023248]|uniref:hypothetical protein n=1 Tax=unclassified Paenibacillus TaxID=185978 RepID=UPI002379C814|nr:hypothetical protein [Paenibacillus sp. MAHUQ-63]MDD9266707.1 hypothetical protein [Paenibacillus sp. MAHUQ-63]